MEIFYIIIGILVVLAGGVIYLYLKELKKNINLLNDKKNLELEFSKIHTLYSSLEIRFKENDENLKKQIEKNLLLEKTCSGLSAEKENFQKQGSLLQEEREKLIELSKKHSFLQSDYENLKKRVEEEKKQIEDLQKKFSDSFENLANQILEQKSRKFTDLNKNQLEEILNPLKEKIKDFQEKVEKNHNDGLEKNAALSTKLEEMQKLTLTLSKEADHLAKALKGENKAQGDWGEMILERILETSGFKEGIHYISQGRELSLKDSDGKNQKPDIIIQLPDQKHLIVDSKVSLVAYEKWVNAENEEDQKKASQELLKSVSKHIQDLSSKEYQKNKDLNSPDFVFLFMPIEPVLNIVLSENKKILEEAWKKNIMILTPTTLTATLWTINNIWKQENQIQNVKEIFKIVEEIHDKIILILDSFEETGRAITKAKESYDEVFSRSKTGKGNLISKLTKLKEMGVSSQKTIPKNFIGFDSDE